MSKQAFVPYIDSNDVRVPHYFLDKKTDFIYFIKKHSGKYIKFSTFIKYPDINKAKKYANAEFDRRTGKKKVLVRTLIREETKAYLKVKEAENLAYDTMNNIKRGIKDIDEFWGDKLSIEINQDTVSEWIEYWHKKHPGLQMENAIKYMRNFCEYLTTKTYNGMPLLVTAPKIRDPNRSEIRAKRKKKKELIFSSDDFKKIYDAAQSLEERVMCLFMYTMATRVTETLELRFDSEIYLDLEVPIYRWRIGQNKADLDGYHALHPVLIEPLRELRLVRKKQGTKRLFPQKIKKSEALKSQQINWKSWESRANIGWHWTPHTFRHTCLSNLFNMPNNAQLLICKLYRISYKEAEETYVKPTMEGISLMKSIINVLI